MNNVQKKYHWKSFENDIAKISQSYIDHIHDILDNPENKQTIHFFNEFSDGLRDLHSQDISDHEIIEMLALHMVTKPVFDALFGHYRFTEHNPISKGMQKILEQLDREKLDKERATLQAFYESVKMRATGIDSVQGRQRIIIELYDKFFRNAFPRMTERLGIVYTPVEVVDFIIHSIEHVLKTEFGSSLAEPNVHILDPFTGSGTFITRMLQSGIITKDKLPHKYKREIHANEIVLLAYYIATINIESTYHSIMTQQNDAGKTEKKEGGYTSFAGICLTDTFEMAKGRQKDIGKDILLKENNERVSRQQALDIQVIMSNPPYSAGQESANDNNANLSYPDLDKRIRETYAKYSTATNKNTLYDSYIRAIRWASDRIMECGVLGFVSNASFIDSNTGDGLRKCLAEEFTSLYIFHLRGNTRTASETARKEGGQIFGSGSRAPIAISILVKNPNKNQRGQIYFHDIGDYLTRQQKLETIRKFGNIDGITRHNGWINIVPDRFNDWINQRDPDFNTYISMGDKKDRQTISIFDNYSRGLESARDPWSYNASKIVLQKNINQLINTFNNEVKRYQASEKFSKIEDFVIKDSTKISWSSSLLQKVTKNITYSLNIKNIYYALYRPFSKQYLYFDSIFNHRTGQMPQIFPTTQTDNRVICVTGLGVTKKFSCIICNVIPDVQLQANGQCFPLYLYDISPRENDLLEKETPKRRYAITNDALKHFQAAYPDQAITREDIFYYIYGLLHSEDYRSRYEDNLTKELPRIPRVKSFYDFTAFTQAGRMLADLHLNYETADCYTGVEIDGLTLTPSGIVGRKDHEFHVTKMRFPQRNQKTEVIYNDCFTIRNIPEEAYDYIVNGKSALEWVMERQSVTTDKKTGITNDANDWAIETMHDPKYPLELFLRVITVSLATSKIVNALPKLKL